MITMLVDLGAVAVASFACVWLGAVTVGRALDMIGLISIGYIFARTFRTVAKK
jgi:hypothetical protein